MKFFKTLAVALLLLALSGRGFSEISPLSLSFFGVYGSPVDPSSLSLSTPNGWGFSALGEWNATSYTSFGLGFEQVSFSPGSSFTVPMANFEARLFPMENEKGKFSPYLYGGAGLNLASAAPWQGPVQLVAGLGSRVSLTGPVFFDLAVGSHWLQAPNAFQYVDFRYGLSLSLGFHEKQGSGPSQRQEAKPAEKSAPAATPEPTLPAPTPTAFTTPVVTPMAAQSQAATLIIDSAPVTSLAESKMYYKIGMDAFLAENYPYALKALKKSLTLKEKHKKPYKYAETYATIGVIWQFHAQKVKGHDKKALVYYRKALAIDPTTKSAKKFYKKLKAKVAREEMALRKKKGKPKPKPTPAEEAPAAAETPLPAKTKVN